MAVEAPARAVGPVGPFFARVCETVVIATETP